MIRLISIYVAALAVTATTIQAEQLRLAEFIYDGGRDPVNGTQLPASVGFYFNTSRGGPESLTVWLTNHIPSDIGQTITAPPEIVEGIARVASFPDTIFYATNDGSGGAYGSGRFHELRAPTGNPGFDRFELGLLKLVPSLAPYRITKVDRTLNDVDLRFLDTNNNRYVIGGKQTVTLYGVLVPEPGSILMLLAGAAYFVTCKNARRWNRQGASVDSLQPQLPPEDTL